MKEINLKVNGMHCKGCENRIKNLLSTIDGVDEVIANHINGTVVIKANKEIINCISLIISAYKHNQTTIDFDFSEMFESISLPSKKEVRKIRKRINY